jgi:hypothetical protein
MDLQANGTSSQAEHMNAFYQLLNTSQFLLIFVQTLEEQRSFTMKDK